MFIAKVDEGSCSPVLHSVDRAQFLAEKNLVNALRLDRPASISGLEIELGRPRLRRARTPPFAEFFGFRIGRGFPKTGHAELEFSQGALEAAAGDTVRQ